VNCSTEVDITNIGPADAKGLKRAPMSPADRPSRLIQEIIKGAPTTRAKARATARTSTTFY